MTVTIVSVMSIKESMDQSIDLYSTKILSYYLLGSKVRWCPFIWRQC